MLSACSEKIMEPDIPHALRLQAILIGKLNVSGLCLCLLSNPI